MQDRRFRIWGKLQEFRLDWVPRCRYVIWSKLLLESEGLKAGRCWCWDQSSRGGVCTGLARPGPRKARKDGEGLLLGTRIPLTLRQQGSCGEVESGVIRRFLVLHWLIINSHSVNEEKAGFPKRGRQSSRRLDLTLAIITPQRDSASMSLKFLNAASECRPNIRKSSRAFIL